MNSTMTGIPFPNVSFDMAEGLLMDSDSLNIFPKR